MLLRRTSKWGGRDRKRECGISENTVKFFFQKNTEPQNTRDQADRLTLSDALAKLVASAGRTREIGPSQKIPKKFNVEKLSHPN